MTAPDGKPEKPVSVEWNGSMWTHVLKLNLRMVPALAAFLVAVTTIGGTMALWTKFLFYDKFKDEVRDVVREELAPYIVKTEAQEKILSDHLYEAIVARYEYATDSELKAATDEIKGEIAEIRRQQRTDRRDLDRLPK